MNTRTILNGAALILGLAVTATSSAQVAPDVDPSRMTQEQREAYRVQRQSDMAAMTSEQRAEAKASRGQAGSAQGQGKGTMARDGSGTGGQYGKAGGQGGGRSKGR
ncbi:MAG: hypothetical protein Q8M01_05350 [Rubrivivax sp.]|nr:hypothetical protein [Rubrivivax sp.]